MSDEQRRKAHEYAEGVRKRAPEVVRRMRERAKLTRYGLAQVSNVEREMIRRVENGVSVPSIYVFGKLMIASGAPMMEVLLELFGEG